MNKFELMALPYAPDALEPVISKETIGFHHGKHLQAYVDNLNKLASPPDPSPIGEGSLGEIETLEEIVRKVPAGALFNNAGQILNHELYFLQFKPVGEAAQGPKGALAAQISERPLKVLRGHLLHRLRSNGVVWRPSRLSLRLRA